MTPWVLRLLVANAAVYLVARPDSPLYAMLAFSPQWVFSRPWSIVTYMFLHGGMGHLLFNMIILFFFAQKAFIEGVTLTGVKG